MKKVCALVIILFFAFGMVAGLAYAGGGRDNAWDRTAGAPGLINAREQTARVAAGHANPNATDPTAALAFPEFPMVALPGIVGFAGLALAWLKRFFYR